MMNGHSLRLAIFIAAIVGGFYVLVSSEAVSSLFGFEFRGQDVPIWHAALAFVMTFLGVLFSLIIQNNNDGIVNIGWSEFGRSILKYSTPGSIIVSAIVYAYAFQTLYGSVGDWLAYFSAFQSGFFFNQTLSAVLAAFKGQKAAKV
jgi:hypothetical protein